MISMLNGEELGQPHVLFCINLMEHYPSGSELITRRPFSLMTVQHFQKLYLLPDN